MYCMATYVTYVTDVWWQCNRCNIWAKTSIIFHKLHHSLVVKKLKVKVIQAKVAPFYLTFSGLIHLFQRLTLVMIFLSFFQYRRKTIMTMKITETSLGLFAVTRYVNWCVKWMIENPDNSEGVTLCNDFLTSSYSWIVTFSLLLSFSVSSPS